MRYTLGDYTLDTQRYELCRAGLPLQLQPKVFELLAYLIQHRDRVVTRQALFDALWPEHFVSDDALEWVIAAARRAVGDNGRTQRVIKTVRGRGYRFVAPIAEQPQAGPEQELLPAPACALATEERPVLAPPMGGERKQVTVLAVTLSLVVTQAAGMEAETLHMVRQRVFTLVQQEVQRYAGTIQHFVDNVCLAFFGAPVAQEDHARRAVLAALRLQECLRHTGAALGPGTAQERTVSMSLHTGEVIVGSIGADSRQIALAVGDTTQMADQLLRLAEPGAIVLSAATARLVRDLLRLDPVAPGNVPGVTASPTVYKVLGLLPYHPALGWPGRRVVRQFVGREREMGTLQALLAQVEAGHGQVVGIAGEPGIGKSRLLHEFRQQVRYKPCTYLAGRCVSYGQATPYLPLLDLLRQACGLTDGDTPDETAAMVARYLADVGMAPETWSPYVLRVLDIADDTDHLPLSPQVLRTRSFEALLQMQLHASHQRPLILEVEDVHWIDPTSEEWLMALVERLAGVPILLLLSYRAGYHPAWIGKSYATQLALQRLTAHESQRIVRTVLAPQAVADGLVRTIVAKGQGNPFFLEELAQAVMEQEGQQPTLVIPETVQAVLTARLDRLPPEAKALLQVAAVIGPELPGALLQVVTGCSEATLCQHLACLQGAELLYEARSVPEPVYAFQHALTQEVAYHSLLRSTRRQYHQQIAEVLERLFPTMVEAQPELLAQHYTQAGIHQQAVAYWHKAGQRASEHSAHMEAVVHLTRGLEVLQTLPETMERARCELGLYLTLGPSLSVTRGHGVPEVGHAWTRARELCEQVGDILQMSGVLQGLFAFHLVQGKLQTALELAEELLGLARREPDGFLYFEAHFEMGVALFFRGALVLAQGHFERAMAISNPQQRSDRTCQDDSGDSVIVYLSHLAWNLSVLGYPDQAMTHIREALTRSRELGHPYSRMYALLHAIHVHELRREVQAIQEHAETMIAICEEQGFAHWLAVGRFYQGWTLVAQGHKEAGVTQMRQGVTSRKGLIFPYIRALLAETFVHVGQPEAGWAMLMAVIEEVEQSEGRFYTAEIYRLKGELLLRQTMTNAPQAEACLQQALALARRSQAKWWELRAAMSLARLWQHQDKRQDAYDLLAPVYAWFTEGFDTPDLQEAQVLCHQPSSAPRAAKTRFFSVNARFLLRYSGVSSERLFHQSLSATAGRCKTPGNTRVHRQGEDSLSGERTTHDTGGKTV
jgi:DNA-binding winged helix-turn-helix (wHTH) protein/tetratricopeptide (TPR) repeat protein